jgi:hypothetical protein
MKRGPFKAFTSPKRHDAAIRDILHDVDRMLDVATTLIENLTTMTHKLVTDPVSEEERAAILRHDAAAVVAPIRETQRRLRGVCQ